MVYHWVEKDGMYLTHSLPGHLRFKKRNLVETSPDQSQPTLLYSKFHALSNGNIKGVSENA